MTRFADSVGRKRATGELQSAARGGGELPTSRRDVEINKIQKKPSELIGRLQNIVYADR